MGLKKEWLVFVIFLFSINSFCLAEVQTPSSVGVDTGIVVYYEEFSDSTLTTQFIYLSDLGLQNIANMVLDNNYGTLSIEESVNLTESAVADIVDLDSGVDISTNRLFINTSFLSSLNKTALLSFKGITFNNPRILIDNEICPSEICERVNYSGNVFVLRTNLTGDFVYSLEETPAVSSGSSSSGSGGSALQALSSFEIQPSMIKINLKQGEVKREVLKIKNLGNSVMDFNLKNEFSRYLLIDRESFNLRPGETATINLDFFSRENEIPDVYTGRVVITSGKISEALNLILEIQEKKPLFDIRTKILNNVLVPGEGVQAEISLVNMGDLKNIDVVLYYAIKDLDNFTLLYREESLAINDTLNLVRGFNVPENLEGVYVFYSKVSYQNVSAASADLFQIQRRRESEIYSSMDWRFMALGFFLLFIIALILARVNKKNSR